MNREEFIKKWVLFENGNMVKDLDELLSLPPAEGAEEILEDIAMRIDASGVGNNRDAIKRFYRDKLNTLATLHAQRIAEKMVEERLRKELIAYDKWLNRTRWGMREVLSPEKAVDRYLKSKEQ